MAGRRVRGRRPARPAGVAQAGVDGSGLAGRRPAAAALVAKDRDFTEDDKLRPARHRTGAAPPGRAGVPRRRARADRSSCRARRSITRSCRCSATPIPPCARTRTPARPRDPVRPPGRCAAPDRAGAGVPRADVRPPADGHVAVGGIGVRRGGGPDGRGRRCRGSPPTRTSWRVRLAIALPRDRVRPCASARDSCTGRIDSARTARSRLFRDHALSDRIGFHYQSWDAAAAAADFVERVREAGRRFRGGDRRGSRHRQRDPGRRERLGALPRRRSPVPAGALRGAQLRPPTFARSRWPRRRRRRPRRCRRCIPARGSTPTSTSGLAIATTIAPGRSWRRPAPPSTATRPACRPGDRDRAFEELLIAEGSDWFWWYGDDHSSDHDREFDELFRRASSERLRGPRRCRFRTSCMRRTSPPVRRPIELQPLGFGLGHARRSRHQLPGVGGCRAAGAWPARRRHA